MASNKTPQAQLQRRHGRRVSVPSSPILFDRRPGDRSARADVNSPVEPSSTSATGSPLIDWPTPSAAFDVPGFSSPVSTNDPEDTRFSTWERHNGTDTRANEDSARSPSIGTPASDAGTLHPSRHLPTSSAFRSSPLSHFNRDGNENIRTPDRQPRFYERSHAAARNTSATSLSTDRSLSDEQSSTKVSSTKKSRLNLLNPMSLLARRRSSQNSKLEDLNISPLHVPAIPDFDPSIRGNIVHDFSSPRTRTPRRDIVSSPAPGRLSDDDTAPPPSLSSPVMRSPVFKEHFQDDRTSLQPGQTAYLHNRQLDPPQPEALPVFAQKLPVRLPSQDSSTPEREPPTDIPHPEAPPPPPPNKTPSPSLEVPSTANLPKHMKSTSSRFSFQISGQGSAAQEKILEDKHREHFAKQPTEAGDVEHAVEDDYDDYDLDAEDIYEEDIPIAGVDDEHDLDGDPPIRNIEVATSHLNLLETDTNQVGDLDTSESLTNKHAVIPTQINGSQNTRPPLQPLDTTGATRVTQPIQEFHFTPITNTMSPGSPEYGSGSPARDLEGRVIGVANTRNSPVIYRPDGLDENKHLHAGPQIFLEGLQISTVEPPESSLPVRASSTNFDDADLYFDDGEFDLEDMEPGDRFDESMLDEESEQIRDIPAENARRYEAAMQRSALGEEMKILSPNGNGTSRGNLSSDIGEADGMQQRHRRTTLVDEHESSGLTEGNLAAYHDALVMAANNAAASGKFNRQVSFDEDSEQHAESLEQNSRTGPVSEEGRYSVNIESSGVTDDDPFAFDYDDMDDDLMIAEANAEALENDDDGFYGQEFGFYARAHNKDSSDFVNGGYFTSRGSNGVKRSHSGKANFQEPSLTPITERSEWSTRNSVVSLQFHGGIPNSAQSLPSPGISQLLDSPLLDEEPSLSALMKLRRGAFGGSSTSVNSLGDRNLPNSSPLAHVSTYKFPSQEMSSARKLSMSQSIQESEEEDEDTYDRPTMTQNTPKKKGPELAPHTPHEQINPHRLSPQPSLGRRSQHSRTSSGAESISYSQDDNGRWILERRRTSEDGELEVIGREYLAGARI